MANEINVQLSLVATKNGVTFQQNLSKTITMAGDEMIQNTQIIGTANEAVVLGDVAVGGYAVFKNLDATNYVELFTDSGDAQPFAKLLAGEPMLLKTHPSATYYAKANTGSVKLLVFALEI
jgi:hypothetical protein